MYTGSHAIEMKFWNHQYVKLKKLKLHQSSCVTQEGFFLHIPVPHPLSHEIANDCLNTLAYIKGTLTRIIWGSSYWWRMWLMQKTPNPHHLSSEMFLYAWLGRALSGTNWPHPADFKASNFLFHQRLTHDTLLFPKWMSISTINKMHTLSFCPKWD